MKKCRHCGRRHEPIPHDKTVILGYYEGIPIVKAIPDEKKEFLIFYCQYCKREHIHGYADGHRVAHCDFDKDTPFSDKGYFLNQTLLCGYPMPPERSVYPKWEEDVEYRAGARKPDLDSGLMIPKQDEYCGSCVKYRNDKCERRIYKEAEKNDIAVQPLDNICSKFVTCSRKRTYYTSGGVLKEDIIEQIEYHGKTIFVKKNFSDKVVSYLPMIRYDRLYLKPIKGGPWKMPTGLEEFGSFDKLWGEVRSFIYEHLDLGVDTEYDVLTAWVFMTWTVEKYDAVPYLLFLGPRDSGKTWAMQVLAAVSLRGWLTVGATPASLFRCTQSWEPTAFLDETEQWLQSNREDIVSYINSGYRRGISVPRVEQNESGSFETKLFQIFGPKAMTSTKEHLETLMSRAIVIPMSRAIRAIKNKIDEVKALELRNKLLSYRFETIGACAHQAHFAEGGGAEALLRGKGLRGRLIELYEPLVDIAPNKEIILDYALGKMTIIDDEEQGSIESIVFNAILNCEIKTKPSNGQKVILYSDIYNSVNNSLMLDEHRSPQEIGMVIKRLGFNRTRMGSDRAIVLDEKLISRLKHRYPLYIPQSAPTAHMRLSSLIETEKEKSP